MELLKKAKDKSFWEKVRTDSKYAFLIERTKKTFENSRTQPVPSLPYSLRNHFKTTGSRSEFEQPYFLRRQYLMSSALLALIYPENQSYFDELQDVIWAITEESSWALPAHTETPWGMPAETCIDLFAAETGFSLAEICYLLSDRLDGAVLERVKRETEQRIINAYLTREFWWESCKGNWAAVCAGCVACTFLYLAPERFDAVSERIDSTMQYFLSSFTEEGVCEEGLSYWQYGFGSFVWFADLLYQFTDGKKDYFAKKNVETIAAYAQKNYMCGNQAVSFSDATRNERVHGALMNFLSNRYPQSVHTLPEEVTDWLNGVRSASISNWIRSVRDFVYFDLIDEKGRLDLRSHDFLGSGQVIVNSEKYSLAVKATHNDEQHNHNDVGTFILSTKQGQIFCDYGAGRYTAKYFSEFRYDYLCTSSRGHSVPIVNGAYQKAGREFCGTVAHNGNEITVEMANAYGQSSLEGLTRKFRYCNDYVELTDSYLSKGKSGSYTERFVTLIEPKVGDGYMIVGNVKLTFEKTCANLSVSSEEQEKHNTGGEADTVYLIDFALKAGVESVKFVFEIL